MSVIDNSPMNRADRRRIQTHQQLLSAANQLMISNGYADLTIRAITELADVGYGTFYLHFKDLDDVVWEIIYQMVEDARLRTEAHISKLPFPMREYQSWVFLFDFAAQMREGISQLFGRNGSATLLQRYQAYLAALHEENLRAGHYSSGLDLPPVFLAQFITGALVRLLVWWSETPNTYTPQQMADMMYQTVYRQAPPR